MIIDVKIGLAACELRRYKNKNIRCDNQILSTNFT